MLKIYGISRVWVRLSTCLAYSASADCSSQPEEIRGGSLLILSETASRVLSLTKNDILRRLFSHCAERFSVSASADSVSSFSQYEVTVSIISDIFASSSQSIL